MKVSNGHINNLIEFISTKYGSANQLIELSGLKDDVHSNPIGSIKESRYIDFLKHAIKISNDDKFGLNYGCFLNLKSLGLILEISLNTHKIDQAIYLLQEYLKATFSMVQIDFIDKDDAFTIKLNCTVNDFEVQRHLLDAVFCVIYRELKLMLDTRYYPKIGIPYRDSHAYEVALKTNDIILENGYYFFLNKELLHLEINRKKLKQIEYLLPKFLLEIDLDDTKGELSSKVKKTMLNLCSPEIPGIDQVVMQFPLSKRSFQRHLLKEKTSFRELSNKIKRELAYYLENGNVFQTNEIAAILGYSESSAYLHAKKNW